MKKVRISAGFLLLSCNLSFGQMNVDVINNVNELIKNKKYETAYSILQKADPENQDPDLVIQKTNLLLDYFVVSIAHTLFSLKDLEPQEDIMDVRGSQGETSMFSFEVPAVFASLLKKYPDNYLLMKTLGRYYHEVHLKYNKNWFEPDSIVVDNFEKNYRIAYKNGVYDYNSLYAIGYANLLKGKTNEAIGYFLKSIELNKDYPSSHYNLAYAYLYTDRREKAIEYAKNAFALYEYPAYKADAAKLIGITYGELNDFENAKKYFRLADTINPNDYYVLRPLLNYEVLTKDVNYKITSDRFLKVDPENPTIYEDLIKIYFQAAMPDSLIKFLNAKKNEYKESDMVYANLFFYIAKIQYDHKDYQNSKENFEKARGIFKMVLGPDHDVFKVIDYYLNEM